MCNAIKPNKFVEIYLFFKLQYPRPFTDTLKSSISQKNPLDERKQGFAYLVDWDIQPKLAALD